MADHCQLYGGTLTIEAGATLQHLDLSDTDSYLGISIGSTTGGTINSSGTVNITRMHLDGRMACTWNILDGVTTVSQAVAYPWEAQPAQATINLAGGVLDIRGAYFHFKKPGNGSVKPVLNIAGGSFIVDGNITNVTDAIDNSYDGIVTAYDGSGVFTYAYDEGGDYTTIGAVDAGEMVFTPANDDVDVSIDADLSWTAPAGLTGVTYDVYLSTDQGDVEDANSLIIVSSGQSELTYDPDLDYLTDYYWRIVAHADGGVNLMFGTLHFTTEPPVKAYGPAPADDAVGIAPPSTLTWACNGTPDSYNVYFSAVKADVDDRSAPMTNELVASHVPVEKDWNTQYYWAVDAVFGGTPVAGDTWTFTISPFLGATIVPLDVAVSSQNSGDGMYAVNTINGSGMSNGGQFPFTEDQALVAWGGDYKNTWGSGGAAPHWIMFNLGSVIDTVTSMRLWNPNYPGGSYSGLSEADIYISTVDIPGSDFSGANWSLHAADVAIPRSPEAPDYRGFLIILNEAGLQARWVALADLKPHDSVPWVNFGEIRFFATTDKATNVSPADGSGGNAANTDLVWAPGWKDGGLPDSTHAEINGGDLDWSTTYYWAVDEVYGGGATIIPSDVWEFTVANTLVCGDIPADLSGDCIVDLEDFGIMAAAWLDCDMVNATCP